MSIPNSSVKFTSSNREFLEDILTGLSVRPRRLPCKYFYDQRGSRLFDDICRLDEYYLARTEVSILEAFAPQMAEVIGSDVMLVEYGSGSSVKTRLLLDQIGRPTTYVPLDISHAHLKKVAARLASRYPDIQVQPVCADFTNDFELPPASMSRRVVYFPGSTIGNFTPAVAVRLMTDIARRCSSGGGLLVGVDLQKESRIIEAAYNDAKGVTAAFNLNLLRRLNRELGANFDLQRFEHLAFYNSRYGRVETYLVSQCDQSVTMGSCQFSFSTGERICTEYSHKYSIDGFAQLASEAGLTQRRVWTDPQQWFAVLYLDTRN